MVTIFQFFVERAVPSFANQLFGIKMKGMLENPSSRYFTIIFYNLWVGFGTSVLMYSNGMSGISQEMVESAHLDGATGLTEFWKITLPMIYPTLSTFLLPASRDCSPIRLRCTRSTAAARPKTCRLTATICI